MVEMKEEKKVEGAVTDKGFISFAAEKIGRKKGSVGAAKVMKPCSELNLGGKVDL